LSKAALFLEKVSGIDRREFVGVLGLDSFSKLVDDRAR
jgi:hypothetical protein